MNARVVSAAARIALLATVAVVMHLATTETHYAVVEDSSDKVNHALAFAVLSLLVDFSFPGSRFGAGKIVALLGFGALIEFIQYFIPYRECSLLDLAADGAGIALYVLCRPLIAKARITRSLPMD
jgi:VanZ family protein